MAMTGGRGHIAGTVAVAVTDLSFSYGRAGHRLDNVSLVLHEAEVCCLLGPNGAGKTTLIRCLLGFLRLEHGQVTIAGHDLARLSPKDLARLVAYVPQHTSTPFPFTALEIAVMGRTPHLGIVSTPSAADRTAALSELERLGIAHVPDRPFSALSGGERQLTLLARALLQRAPVLVLDEPTTALDYGNELQILQLISNLASAGQSVLMITHQPAHALTYADRAALMHRGQIVAQGRPVEIITSQRLSDLYGVPIEVARFPLPGQGGREVAACVPIPNIDRRAGPAR